MIQLDLDQLARITGGFMRRPRQQRAVIRGSKGGIPLVSDRHDGGPPNVIKGPAF